MKSNHSQLIVIGSGPGGYTAAFRAADLGLNVTLIDKSDSLGGVCLNQGCIPSKSLLHVSNIINSAENSKNLGVEFSKPNIDINKIQNWKNSIISNLGIGIKKLAQARKINIITYGKDKYSDY